MDGEILHFRTYIRWMEERTVTKRVNYSGFTYSTKIIGNVRWKAGTITPHRIQSSELQEIDSGVVLFQYGKAPIQNTQELMFMVH